MSRQILYGKKKIRFDVVQSKRIKTSEVIVEPYRVLVRSPYSKSLQEIDSIVQRKASWIVKKQNEYEQIKNQTKRPTFAPDSRLPYLGNLLPLRIINRHQSNKFRFINGEFIVTLRSSKLDKKRVKSLYESWLSDKAPKILFPIVRKYSRVLRVKPRSVKIKNLRARWGSATKNNILNLNVYLIKAPENVISYIVLHELCHFKIRDHSDHFWDLVSTHMPDYKDKADWLSKNFMNTLE